MIEKIVHTAKHTVKARVLDVKARFCSPGVTFKVFIALPFNKNNKPFNCSDDDMFDYKKFDQGQF